MRHAARRYAPTLVTLALFAGIAEVVFPGFLSLRTAFDLLADNAVLGLAAIGETIVLVAGGIDLSVGALMALSSIVFARLVSAQHVEPASACALVLVLGASCGAGMGALVAFVELPAFIVTLGGMFLFRGAALGLAEESLAIADPRWSALSGAALDLGPERLRLTGCVLLAAVLVVAIAMRQARPLRHAYAVGGDERAARLAGIPVRGTRVMVHALSGFFAALAGLAFALYGASGSAVAGSGLELEAIAVAVVGGVALSGGQGSVIGTLLGILLFGLIQDVILVAGTLSAGWTRVAMGVLLLVFVALQRLLERPERWRPPARSARRERTSAR